MEEDIIEALRRLHAKYEGSIPEDGYLKSIARDYKDKPEEYFNQVLKNSGQPLMNAEEISQIKSYYNPYRDTKPQASREDPVQMVTKATVKGADAAAGKQPEPEKENNPKADAVAASPVGGAIKLAAAVQVSKGALAGVHFAADENVKYVPKGNPLIELGQYKKEVEGKIEDDYQADRSILKQMYDGGQLSFEEYTKQAVTLDKTKSEQLEKVKQSYEASILDGSPKNTFLATMSEMYPRVADDMMKNGYDFFDNAKEHGIVGATKALQERYKADLQEEAYSTLKEIGGKDLESLTFTMKPGEGANSLWKNTTTAEKLGGMSEYIKGKDIKNESDVLGEMVDKVIADKYPDLPEYDRIELRSFLMNRAKAEPVVREAEIRTQQTLKEMGIAMPGKDFEEALRMNDADVAKTMTAYQQRYDAMSKNFDAMYTVEAERMNLQLAEQSKLLQQDLNNRFQAGKITKEEADAEYDNFVKQARLTSRALYDAKSRALAANQRQLISEAEKYAQKSAASVEELYRKYGIEPGEGGEKLMRTINGITRVHMNNIVNERQVAADAEWRKLSRPGRLGTSLSLGVNQMLDGFGATIKYIGYDDFADAILDHSRGISETAPAPILGDFKWSDMTNPDWVQSRVVTSLPTTVALMGVGGMVMRGASTFAGGLGLSVEAGSGIKLTYDAAKALSGTSRASQMFGAAIGGGGARIAESYMEAGFKYQEALDNGESVEEATRKANNVFDGNLALLPLDMAQMYMTFAKVPGRLATQPGFAKYRIYDAVANNFMSKMAFNTFTQGSEEIWQEWQNVKQENPFLTFSEFVQSPHAKEAFASGAGMGGAFTFMGGTSAGKYTAVNNLMRTQLATFDKQGEGIKPDDILRRSIHIRQALEQLQKTGDLTQAEFNDAIGVLETSRKAFEQSNTGTLPIDWRSAAFDEAVVLMADIDAVTAQMENASESEKVILATKQKALKAELEKLAKDPSRPVYTVQGVPVPREVFLETLESEVTRETMSPLDFEATNDPQTYGAVFDAYAEQGWAEGELIRMADEQGMSTAEFVDAMSFKTEEEIQADAFLQRANTFLEAYKAKFGVLPETMNSKDIAGKMRTAMSSNTPMTLTYNGKVETIASVEDVPGSLAPRVITESGIELPFSAVMREANSGRNTNFTKAISGLESAPRSISQEAVVEAVNNLPADQYDAVLEATGLETTVEVAEAYASGDEAVVNAVDNVISVEPEWIAPLRAQGVQVEALENSGEYLITAVDGTRTMVRDNSSTKQVSLYKYTNGTWKYGGDIARYEDIPNVFGVAKEQQPIPVSTGLPIPEELAIEEAPAPAQEDVVEPEISPEAVAQEYGLQLQPKPNNRYQLLEGGKVFRAIHQTKKEFVVYGEDGKVTARYPLSMTLPGVVDATMSDTGRAKVEQQQPATTQDQGRVARNKKDVVDIMATVFGLSKVQAKAAADVIDRLAHKIAFRSNRTVEQVYATITWKKGDAEAMGLEQSPHAAVDLAADGSAIIYALTNPNVTSPIHEMAHVFERYLTAEERATVLEFTGQDGWDVTTSEAFTRGFERFLYDGYTGVPKALADIFVKFRAWMLDIYQSIAGSPIGTELNEPMRALYVEMMSDVKPVAAPVPTRETVRSINEAKDLLNRVATLLAPFYNGQENFYTNEDGTPKTMRQVLDEAGVLEEDGTVVFEFNDGHGGRVIVVPFDQVWDSRSKLVEVIKMSTDPMRSFAPGIVDLRVVPETEQSEVLTDEQLVVEDKRDVVDTKRERAMYSVYKNPSMNESVQEYPEVYNALEQFVLNGTPMSAQEMDVVLEISGYSVPNTKQKDVPDANLDVQPGVEGPIDEQAIKDSIEEKMADPELQKYLRRMQLMMQDRIVDDTTIDENAPGFVKLVGLMRDMVRSGSLTYQNAVDRINQMPPKPGEAPYRVTYSRVASVAFRKALNAETLSKKRIVNIKVELRRTDRLVTRFMNSWRPIEVLMEALYSSKLEENKDIDAIPDPTLDQFRVVEKIELAKARAAYQSAKLREEITGLGPSSIRSGKATANSLLGRAKASGVTLNMLNDFMYLRGAKSFNARVREISQKKLDAEYIRVNQKIADATASGSDVALRYWEQVKEQMDLRNRPGFIVKDNGSGLSDTEIDTAMDEYRKLPNYAEYEKFADEFDSKVIKPTLDMLYQMGRMDEDNYIGLKKGAREGFVSVLNHYVPRKVKPTSIDDLSLTRATAVQGAPSSGIKGIKGTEDYSIDERMPVVQQAIMEYEATVSLMLQNEAIASLGDIATELKDPSFWKVEPARAKVEVDENGELIDYDDLIDQNIKDNSVVYYKKVQVRVKNETTGKYELKNESRKYYLFFNPRLKKDGTGNEPSPVLLALKAPHRSWMNLGIVKFISAITNYLRLMTTGISIQFGLSNLPRDVEDALNNLAVFDTVDRRKLRKDFAKALMPSFRSLISGNGAMASVVDEAYANGVKMSFYSSGDVLEVATDLTKEINRNINGDYKSSTPPGVFKTKYGEVLYNAAAKARYYNAVSLGKIMSGTLLVNEALENTTRIATYHALRQQGFSELRAAHAAKNITVNFEKMGTAGKVINMFYMFANAGLGGTLRQLKTLQTTQGKKIAVGMVGIGFILAMLEDLDREEDVLDVAKTGAYKYRDNFVIPLPNGNKFTLTKAYGLIRLFTNLGGDLYNYGAGNQTTGDFISNTFGGIRQMFDPISGSSDNFMSSITPTLLRPLQEYQTNRNFANMPIYSPYDESQKPSEKIGPNTPEWLIEFTQELDDATRINDEAYRGILSFSPALLEYLFKEYTRAPGRMALDLAALATEDKMDLNRLPLARKFWTTTKGASAENRLKGLLYEAAAEERMFPRTARMKEEIEAAWKVVNEKGLLNQRTLGKMWSDIKERHGMDLPYYVNGKKISAKELREKINSWEEKRN